MSQTPPAAPPPQPIAPPASQGTDGLAIASLVTGLLGFCVPLAGVAGIVLGVLGLRRTGPGKAGGQGFAIAGIVAGSISTLAMCLVAPLIGILLPALGAARQTARTVQCQSQMRQVGQALLQYSSTHGTLPPDLATLQLPAHLLVCPAQSGVGTAGGPSYAYNPAAVPGDAASVLLFEPSLPHREKSNLLFGDGQVHAMEAHEADPILNDQELGGTLSPP